MPVPEVVRSSCITVSGVACRTCKLVVTFTSAPNGMFPITHCPGCNTDLCCEITDALVANPPRSR